MKKFFTKAFLTLSAALAFTTLSTNAQTTISPGTEVKATLTAYQNLEIKPLSSGELTMTYPNPYASAKFENGTSGLYTDADRTQEVAGAWSRDFDLEVWTCTVSVDANKIYYLYMNSNNAYGSQEITFNLAGAPVAELSGTKVEPGISVTATLKAYSNLEFYTTAGGELTMTIPGVYSSTYIESGTSGVFTDPDQTNQVEGSWKQDYDTEKWTCTITVEANTQYYMYMTVPGAYGSKEVTFNLNDGGTVEPKPETPEDITLEPGVATKLLKNQKGNVAIPTGVSQSTTLPIDITVNSTQNLGQILHESKFPTDVITYTTSTDGSNLIYHFTGEYPSYGPWYVMQSELDEVEVTLCFPTLEAKIEEVKLDTPFQATANTLYSFTLEEAMILEVTSPVAMTEKEWNGVIYKDRQKASQIYPSTVFKADGEENDEGLSQSSEKKEKVTFNITKTGTYYLYCQNAGEWNLSKYVPPVEKKPFETTVSIVAPIEGVSEALNWVIKFDGQVLDESKSLLSGVTITNPNGQNVSISKVYLTPSSAEGSSANDGLGLMVAPADYDLCRVIGTYIVYVPQGCVYNDNDEPNPEVILNYVLKPTAVKGAPDYFEIDEMTTNVPSLNIDGYVANAVNDLVLSLPFELEYYYEADEEGNVPEEGSITSINAVVNGVSTDATIEDNKIIVPVNLMANDTNLDVTVRFDNNLVKTVIDDVTYVNPPMNVMFTLYAATAKATYSPEAETTFYADTQDKTVTVSWNGLISFNNAEYSFEKSNITIVDEDEDEVTLTYYSNVETSDDNKGIVFNFSGFDAGVYTINIPKGAILVGIVDGEDFSGSSFSGYTLNVATSASFLVSNETSGVSIVPADANGNFTIFNLNGVKVAEGSSSAIRNLDKGIYIINGKKVAVK